MSVTDFLYCVVFKTLKVKCLESKFVMLAGFKPLNVLDPFNQLMGLCYFQCTEPLVGVSTIPNEVVSRFLYNQENDERISL